MGELLDPIFAARGKLFSTAGRNTPVAELTEKFLIFYPPDKPLEENKTGQEILLEKSKEGILLNALRELRTISGARFKGQQLFCLAEKNSSTGRYPAAWLDKDGRVHKLYWQGEELSIQAAFRLRNRTYNGELGIFPDLTTDV